jgi:hypothetical protein
MICSSLLSCGFLVPNKNSYFSVLRKPVGKKGEKVIFFRTAHPPLGVRERFFVFDFPRFDRHIENNKNHQQKIQNHQQNKNKEKTHTRLKLGYTASQLFSGGMRDSRTLRFLPVTSPHDRCSVFHNLFHPDRSKDRQELTMCCSLPKHCVYPIGLLFYLTPNIDKPCSTVEW